MEANTVVPGNDDYYRLRTFGIRRNFFALDAEFGFNPGLVGLQSLWRDEQLAIVHGCGYPQPSYSHFTSMAYWHTGAPNRGNEFGWLGRVADNLAHQRRDNMLVNIGAHQSLAVNSKIHTPVVFDDPNVPARRWMSVLNPQQTRLRGVGLMRAPMAFACHP